LYLAEFWNYLNEKFFPELQLNPNHGGMNKKLL